MCKFKPTDEGIVSTLEASNETGVDLKDFADLREELTKYVDALGLENKTKKEISHLINQFQAIISKPVRLDPKHLSRWFPGIDDAVLMDGEKLVLKKGDKESAVSVLTLDPDPYLAVVKDAAAQVAKQLAEDDAKRAAILKPSLQAFTRLTGAAVFFDWRRFKLVITNTGGPAKHLTVSLSIGDKESYGPFDIDSLQTTEIELRHLRRILDSKSLKIRATCGDEEGRKYAGEVDLVPNTKAVRVFKLKPMDPVSEQTTYP